MMQYDMQMRLALNLKRLRSSFGLSQTQLAGHLGVDRSLYALYESGRRCPDPELIYQAAQLFGIRMELLLEANPDLIAGETASAGMCDEDDLKLMSIYRRLTPFSRGVLMEKAETLQTWDKVRAEQKKVFCSKTK